MQGLDNWSRMNREIHERFSESLLGADPLGYSTHQTVLPEQNSIQPYLGSASPVGDGKTQ